MECSFCPRKAVFYASHFGKAFCEGHFERFMLKKLKRELYRNHLISPGDKILFVSDLSAPSEAALYLLSKAVEKWPVELYTTSSLNHFERVKVWKGERFTKVVDPCPIECEVKRALTALAHGRLYSAGYSYGRVIRPFRKFTSKALQTLAMVRGLEFRSYSGENFLAKYTGEALNLNFLRAYDRVLEALRRQQSKKQ